MVLSVRNFIHLDIFGIVAEVEVKSNGRQCQIIEPSWGSSFIKWFNSNFNIHR